MHQNPLANGLDLALSQFERKRVHDVLLLHRRLALPEKPGLGEVVTEGFAAHPDLPAIDSFSEGLESFTPLGFARGVALKRVPPTRHSAYIDGLAMHAIALKVQEGADRTVDGDFMEVRPSES